MKAARDNKSALEALASMNRNGLNFDVRDAPKKMTVTGPLLAVTVKAVWLKKKGKKFRRGLHVDADSRSAVAVRDAKAQTTRM